MKAGFVILCYQNYKVVFNCVDALRELNGIYECEIVIVDNGSPNNAAVKISDKYKGINNISVINNQDNLGYAKGNNCGYAFLKQKGCDCIIILNSDAYIQNKDFLSILSEEYSKQQSVHVIAPDIVNLDGRHVNPGPKPVYSKLFFIKSIIKNYIALFLLRIGIDYTNIYGRKRFFDSPEVNESCSSFIPHGSCLIFTKNWVTKEDRAFCEDTFLFLEERFLVAYIEKKSYSLCFCNSLKVLHEEDGSINDANPISKEKMMFVLKNQNRSLFKFLRFIHDPIKNWGKLS